MNPNETPPFSSGAIIRRIDPDSVDDGTIPNAEPFTVNNQGPSFTNLYPDQGKSINDSQPPSYNAVRQFIPSNPSGGNTYLFSDSQPPSLNDVNRREASQTGSSYTTGNKNEGSVPKPGMSLTKRNFTKFHPAGAGSSPQF